MGTESPSQRYTPDEDESLSVAIITALSEVKGRDVTEEECVLYKSIDPGALDRMFREDGDENTIKVEFTTHDAIVILWGNGEISLEIQDMEADPSHE
ncbi:HalOD1 output domain-containing protein [Halorubrum xinjiangense]|nr:HalOD1 output domain-containing protein [Halorubrum xinjiangense]